MKDYICTRCSRSFKSSIYKAENLNLKPGPTEIIHYRLSKFDPTSFILKLIKTICYTFLEQKDFVFLRRHLKSEFF